MNDIIANLRKKHTLYVTSVAGILLLVLIGTAIGIMFISVGVEAENAMKQVLTADYDSIRPDDVALSRCFAFVLSGDTAYYFPAYQNEVEYYGDEINDIISMAVNKGEGNFRCRGQRFAVMNTQKNGVTVYAVYDRTADVYRIRSTIFVLLALYLCSMAIISILAYLFSAKTTEPLKDAFDMQKDLIANASHELKTPLAIISANLAVMNAEKSSSIEDNEKWMESISGQVTRMNELVKDMLELSKLEQTTLNKDLVDFGMAVESACLEIEAIAFEKGATLVTDIKKDLFVQGDKSSLERLIIILLDNALKYCGEKGKVGCRLQAENKKLHLEVLNTGSIISEEDAKHVFDRFYRSDGARQNKEGNSFGLGLAIAQATVTAHDGTITCRGIEGKGTIFEVYLPLAKRR